MRILLAEDDPHVSMIMQICLEKIGGHQVTLCEDGESALSTAMTQSFDLILLDGMMPKKEGAQVAREIRASGKVSTPIIFLSAKSEEKDIKLFLSLGTGYIAKPFEPQSICDRINQILTEAGAMVG